MISKRICVVRMRSRFCNTAFVSVHAPHEENDETVKDVFYDQMENVYNNLPRNDVKIFLGDFNVKIGREEHYKSVTGGNSKHEESNENGLRAVAAGENK